MVENQIDVNVKHQIEAELMQMFTRQGSFSSSIVRGTQIRSTFPEENRVV